MWLLREDYKIIGASMSNLSAKAARELADHMRKGNIKFATIYYIRDTREEAHAMKARLEKIDTTKRVVPIFNNLIAVDNGTYMITVNLTASELEILFPETD